jgi:tRNA modification GTPase
MTGSLDDTIAAVSTAPGRAATALVRISGRDAVAVADALGASDLEPRRATVVWIRNAAGAVLDRAVVTLFVGPASFTGEDVVEISAHGGSLVPGLIVDAACVAGARQAMRGEFTRRAYLNGKLDLVQVEATQDLIEANSPALHAAALFQLDGALSRRVERLRCAVLELRALLAYDIDFPEEDDGPISRERIDVGAGALRAQLADMVRGAPEGQRLRDGVMAVLAGAPNAGKSSLFNSLLGSQRAIVTGTPGTTRDAIEADTTVEGFPFRIVDTAGVRADAEEIERMGVEVARRYLAGADIVLLCIEAGRPWSQPEIDLAAETSQLGGTLVVVRTKADIAEPGGEAAAGEILVSAVTGAGVSELRERLVRTSFGVLRESGEPALITRSRHLRALELADRELAACVAGLMSGLPAEIADTHLSAAAFALEEIIGVTEVEDLLGAIFESFCVGK